MIHSKMKHSVMIVALVATWAMVACGRQGKTAEGQGRAGKEKEEKGKMAEGQGRAGKDKKE